MHQDDFFGKKDAFSPFLWAKVHIIYNIKAFFFDFFRHSRGFAICHSMLKRSSVFAIFMEQRASSPRKKIRNYQKSILDNRYLRHVPNKKSNEKNTPRITSTKCPKKFMIWRPLMVTSQGTVVLLNTLLANHRTGYSGDQIIFRNFAPK